MRIRRLQERARPFRYLAFWLMAGVCLLLPGEPERAYWQPLAGGAFCLIWPPLAAGLLRLRRAGCGGTDLRAYAAECGLTAAVFAWVSVPPLAGLCGVVCLLGGAAALAGPRLLWPAAALLVAGAGTGALLAPVLTAASSAAADALAMAQILVFVLALAHVSFRQAQRLDAHRLALTERSQGLERANDRLQRYLPPSLRARLETAPQELHRSERRWLTVAFVDLVGFTALSARLDAEALAAVLDEYLAAVIEAAEQRGGEISKVLGDGVMVVFDAPGGSGNRRAQAAGAVAFCLAVPALLARLEAEWRGRGDLVRLQMRAGIASGYCTVGDRGGAGRLDFTLIGPPVNLASRLEALAPVDGLLMDGATAALVESEFPLQAPRPVDVRGLGRVLVHGLVDPREPSAMVPGPGAESRAPTNTEGASDGQDISARLSR